MIDRHADGEEHFGRGGVGRRVYGPFWKRFNEGTAELHEAGGGSGRVDGGGLAKAGLVLPQKAQPGKPRRA